MQIVSTTRRRTFASGAATAAAAVALAGCGSVATESAAPTPEYPQWGWGTDDATGALRCLRRLSSVTCLNGHVHQPFTKTAGNITFYSGTTTAYPLPHPGDGPAPKPVTLPAGELHEALGIHEVTYQRGTQALAVKDQALQ